MKTKLTIQERLDLIKSVGEEIIGLDELEELLKLDRELITYDGFEPSGQMHIAQGIMRAINTNKMINAGFKFKFYIADWFGYLNKKMGGDLDKIRTVGKYFVEIWKASGMNMDNVEFAWASDVVADPGYWELVMKVAQNTTLNRILRTTQIMGRSDKDSLQASQILYPCMQAVDIIKLGVDVTQLGMDQRKVYMLARSVFPQIGFVKPVIISNHMLMGLLPPPPKDSKPIARKIAMKMSKSKPDSGIFMTDTKEEIERKLKKAYCPEGVVEDNPILEYCRYILFEAQHLLGFEDFLKNGLVVRRLAKFGGDVTYKTYDHLEEAFKEKKLYPLDLKNAVASYVDILIDPVRKHFNQNKEAKKLNELVQSYQVTR